MIIRKETRELMNAPTMTPARRKVSTGRLPFLWASRYTKIMAMSDPPNAMSGTGDIPRIAVLRPSTIDRAAPNEAPAEVPIM